MLSAAAVASGPSKRQRLESSVSAAVIAKPKYADTVAHFATRVRKEVLVKKSKKLKE